MASKPSTAKAERKPTSAALLDDQGIDVLCERIEAGESLTKIAKSMGFELSLLLKWIAADPDRSARARAARSAAAAAYDELAERGIAEAADPFELAKAKEMAHHLRWRASKVNPRSYGDKMAVGGDPDAPPIDHNVTLNVAFVPPK